MICYLMVRKGINPDVASYNALINGLCKSFRISEAVELFEEMIESGCYPDEHTYSLVIGGLCREEKLSKACKLWDQMMEKGFILVQALVKFWSTLFEGRA